MIALPPSVVALLDPMANAHLFTLDADGSP